MLSNGGNRGESFPMDTLTTWEEPIGHRMKVERNLNFSTISNEEDDYGFSRKKAARDPMSHRIIEKRRRDRMNNCLADLSRLVPTNYLKKGRGRIEKTEIIEMAIKHLKHLQAHPCNDPATCEVAKTTEQDHKRQYRLGYQECMSETVRFMVESEGLFSGDGVCVRLINHLQKHYDKVAGGLCYTQALGMMVSEETKSVQMDVDNHSTSCCPSDTCSDGGTVPPDVTPVPNPPNYIYENNRTAPGTEDAAPELKQEPDAPPKVTSQLREMLQNPGLPKEQPHHHQPQPPALPRNPPEPQPAVPSQETARSEEVYKFKNNIKHRFNADLRHHASSPTDSHASLPEDHPAAPQGHAFAPYSSGADPLSVKIPDSHSWDTHAETASSCGSNPSPPPAARSNGSSSGYSTGGENNGGRAKHPYAPHSPALSPYPRTPDRLSNRSPSPQPTGVPIFALHPKGTYYIPLTVEASLLSPYLLGLDDLAPVLHPISICVNLSNQSVKVDKVNTISFQYRQHPSSSFLMEKYHDRYVYADRHVNNMFYPCPSPIRNGCS